MEPVSVIKVDKTQLAEISFGKHEMHETGLSSRLRYKLQRAMILGNLYKCHSTIQFYDAYGRYMETEATVWAVTEQYIMIKGGIVIPVYAIIDLK
jgi:hypothetical protein